MSKAESKLPIDELLYRQGYEQAEKDMKWEIDHAEETYMKGYKDGQKELEKEWLEDRQGCFNDGVQEGKALAEKELALTIKDLELLHTFLYAVKNNKQGVFTFTRLSDEQYEEVLRRFNERKEGCYLTDIKNR